MNIGLLKQMIEQNGELLDDIQGFLTRMNTKDIKIVEQKHTVIEDVVRFVSLAEQNGGELTEKNIQEVVRLISQDPLLDEAHKKHEETLSKIKNGEITTKGEI